MRYGLTSTELAELYLVVIDPLKNAGASVSIFGSRARGENKQFSDIDLLVETKSDLASLIGTILETIENSNFPYNIDIVEVDSLAESYKINVNKDKVPL